MTTKHRHTVRLHRDVDSFTAVDGPLIQVVDTFSSYPTIINMDPPELTKRRKVIANAFTPRAIARLEDGIRSRAASMIDRPLADGGGDWIDDVADLLPMTVIGDIIGIPEDDRPRIFECLDRILKANSPKVRLSRQDETDLYATIFSYALELTADKRRNPADDIWSTLATAVITGEDGEQLRCQRTNSNSSSSCWRSPAVTPPRTRWPPGCRRSWRPGADRALPRPRSGAAQRGRGGVAVVDPGGVLDAHREGGRGDGWPAHRAGRAGGVDVAFGEPRRGGLRNHRSPSTSAVSPTPRWPSGAADRITAWAPCWPARSSARCSTHWLRCDDIEIGPAQGRLSAT